MYRLGILFGITILLLACADHKAPPVSENNAVSWLNSSGKNASPDYQIEFPKDHGPHPEFDIEWWYLTSNLSDANGNKYALQWTLFRFREGNSYTPWIDGQLFMGHASLHSEEQHYFSEKFAGAGLKNAGITENPPHYFIDNWHLKSSEQNALFPANLQATIFSPDGMAEINLNLMANQPFILHGENGYSRKTASSTHASHYYSQPFLISQGTLQLDGKKIPVNGFAWYDHEWSSQLSSNNTLGWDWFSIHLEDGSKLMLFRMRVGNENYVNGTFIENNAKPINLSPMDIQLKVTDTSVSDEREFPSDWHIQIDKLALDIEVSVDKKDAFNPGIFSYYEGSTTVTGSHNGVGFLELTGY